MAVCSGSLVGRSTSGHENKEWFRGVLEVNETAVVLWTELGDIEADAGPGTQYSADVPQC
jgi:hypothetical protein